MKAISGAVFHANRASERVGADSEHWQKRKDQHEQYINWLFDLRTLHPSIRASRNQHDDLQRIQESTNSAKRTIDEATTSKPKQ